MASPPLKSVPIDKAESSNAAQEAKKLNQMSSFAREFYSCNEIDKPVSSNGSHEDQIFNKMGSFAREFYSCHGRDDAVGILVEPGEHCDAPRVARAKHRMEYATDSQLAVLGAEIGEGEGRGGGGMVDKVLAWRKKRNDFNSVDDDDDDERGAFLGDVDVPQLPSDMKSVTENTMRLGFLKSDLQFECLLRNIPYQGSDSKPQLISKLMHYKETLFLNANTFEMLGRQRDDEGGILNDVVESDALVGGEYLTDSQGADLGQLFMRTEIGEGEGAAGPFMRQKTGGFHCDDDDDEDEELDDDDDDDDNNEQEAFLGDEVPQPTPSKFS